MTQSTFDPIDTGDSLPRVAEKMNAQVAALRSNSSGSSDPSNPVAYELVANNSEGVMKQLLGDGSDYVWLWKLLSSPMAIIPKALTDADSIYTVPDYHETFFEITLADGDLTINLPSASTNPYRPLVFFRRDATAHQCFLSIGTIVPTGIGLMELTPGDLIALLPMPAGDWRVLFERRAGIVAQTVSTGTPYAMQWWQNVLLVTTSGDADVTLPAAGSAGLGRPRTVKKVDAAANSVTVGVAGSETIDGASSVVLASQYDRLTVISDGTNWHRID